MREYRISYAKWSEVVGANASLTTAHVWAGGEGTEASHTEVRIAAGNSEFVLLCTITGDDETDWTTEHKAASTECLLPQDAIATCIGTPHPTPWTSADLPATTIMNYPEACEDLRQTWLVDCDPQTIAIRDIWIGGDLVGPMGLCYLAGGAYEIWTSAERGSAIQFAVVDRDDVSGYFAYYGLVRSKLPNLTSIVGTFVAGETVVGGTSGARTTVLAVGADYLDVRFAVVDANGADTAFSAGETITGQTSGATAVLNDPPFDEGDVLYLRKPFLKDEWIYKEAGSPCLPVMIQPGGSKPVPVGYYFRVLVYNFSSTDDLTIKASLIMATR